MLIKQIIECTGIGETRSVFASSPKLAVDIGKELFIYGGTGSMRLVIENIIKIVKQCKTYNQAYLTGDIRELEGEWHGIGDWQM